MKTKHGIWACVLVALALGYGCGAEKLLTQQTKTWEGTWSVTAVTLDGVAEPAYGAVWNLSKTAWSLTTAVCAASGTTAADGNTLGLTVSQTSCPATLPAPVGRTASGTASVNTDDMTLSLSHVLDGVTHTLVTVCRRQ